MPDDIAPSERLLDLVIALTRTPGRMTKAAIRRRVAGYSNAPSDSAFERMFERDKELLRSLGVPIMTVTDPAHGDEVGYRIDTQAYAMPIVEFTAAEMGVLAIAAATWRDAVLLGPAQQGMTKLRGLGAVATETQDGLELTVQSGGEALEPLLRAITDARPVSFFYRAASHGQRQRRTVEPWRLVARGRGWYLVGFDRSRADRRTFRLTRIEPPIVPIGKPGDVVIPPDSQIRADFGPAPGAVRGRARIAVRPERALLLRRRGSRGEPEPGLPGWDVIELDFDDAEELARELAGLADAVVVLDPPELRRDVIARLRAVATAAADAKAARPGAGERGEGPDA